MYNEGMLNKSKELDNMENYDKINAEMLNDLALIYVRNNINDFFKIDLVKQTSYTKEDLYILLDNFLHHRKLSLQKGEEKWLILDYL